MVRIVLAWAVLGSVLLSAQYFGQNKVRHKVLHFEVLHSEHFDIYFYPEERQVAEIVGLMAERWNARLSKILNHVLSTRQPVILYASHTDFEQTTVLPGMISESVGGVTLATGRKVVLPLAGPLKETDHVLGHELVHAFQYDMTTVRGQPQAGELPEWFIEGMAEYLSLGPEDADTAMWLRDAVLRGAMPSVKDLNNPNKYFPYRFGQAFWAFVGGRYGDDKIAPMLLAAAKSGSPEAAISAVLKVTPGQFSAEWKRAALAADQPVLAATAAVPVADVLIAAQSGGAKINVSPALSPDGKWVMFFSERGLFSMDLYLANAQTGAVVRQITATAISAHVNNLEFINSTGAWSADGTRFAFGHIEGGKAYISIYGLAQKRVTAKYLIPGVGEVFTPAWSPDGSRIAMSAITGGLTNLYLLDLGNGTVRQLTQGVEAELQPAWSPDGSELAFVTDRFGAQLGELTFHGYKIALMDLASGAVRPAFASGAGDEINPQWSPDGRSLYFISDGNGIPNLYRGALDGSAPEALTNLKTGISGITHLSPALSVAGRTGEVMMSTFSDGGYSLLRMPPPLAPARQAAKVAALHAALLPPRAAPAGEVATYLGDARAGLPASPASFTVGKYHATLALDYIAPPSLSVGVSPYGTLLGGGTALYFSDLLGYQNLAVGFEALTNNGGEGFLRNLSAQAQYTNDRHRWSWGFGGGQTPFVSEGFTAAVGTLNGVPVEQTQSTTFWELDRQAVGLAAYPFSRAQRVEFNFGYENIGFAAETETQLVNLANGGLISDQKQSLPAPAALNFAVGSAALVYDTSIFGGASPVLGQSYRLQLGMNAGSLDFANALVDYRKYVGLARPLSLAGRFLHYGRYGSGADSARLQGLFLGYPTLVRGYDVNSFTAAECGPELNTTGACPAFDRLLGSKIAVANVELRLELLGPLGLMRSTAVPPVEVAPFYDAGVAWTSTDKPTFFGGTRHPATSEGLTLRVNLFGYAVGSISYAIPNHRPGRGPVWEFSLTPGY